ncbi:SRPBCC family protein [Oerskovia flava]|uniref:SRPBCC family protein n=1 Tax=Oerskovia flava TaxID=2986422 RepID=UPI00223FEA17|nr:SRPBCC family protein [Oerskovia sp. JB1-3-2]
MNDLLAELEAVRREVGGAELPAGAARRIALTRTYDADVADVWDALTDPDRIRRWFLPVTGDLRLGGHYQLEGNAGGEIRVCDEPRRLQVTWIFGEAPSEEDSSIVEVRLEPAADGSTELVLEHVAVVPEEMWDRYGPGATGVGWDLTLLGLAAHLAGVELGDPAEAERSPQMRQAMADSSRAWGAANVAAGADEDEAGAAVTRTTEFYAPPADD